MTTNTITIRFRAKLDDFAGGQGYKVPRLTHSHVSLSQRDSLARDFLAGLNNERLTLARLESWAGLRATGVVFVNAPGDWIITPVGRGFFADISITRPISASHTASREARGSE